MRTTRLQPKNKIADVLTTVNLHECKQVRGTPNVGFIFFDTFLASTALLQSASARFDCLIVGSEWNARMLRMRGLPASFPVHTIVQVNRPCAPLPTESCILQADIEKSNARVLTQRYSPPRHGSRARLGLNACKGDLSSFLAGNLS
jgi:hypothetical protein